MMTNNSRFHEVVHPVVGFPPGTPSTAAPEWVKMTGASRLTIILQVDNATTVTACAVTLRQATSAAGAGAKALAFTRMAANTDTDAGDTLTETAVTSNTFDTDDTDAKNLMYVIEVDESDLDSENDFVWVQVALADAANTVISALYLLWPAETMPPVTAVA